MGAMVTTCPKCLTSFKVSSEQLNAHEGDVRCGQCTTVFNAYDSLASSEARREDIPAIAASNPPAEPHQAAAAVTLEPETLPVPDVPEYQVESLEQITYSSFPEPMPDTETQDDDASTIAPLFPSEEISPSTIAPAIHQYAEDPEELAVTGSRKSVWPWLSGSILLLLALLSQPMFFRYQLAYFDGDNFNNNGFGVHGAFVQSLTELGAEMVVLCNRIACPGRHDLLNYSDNMSIESSELQADPARPTVVILNAVLRNHAKFHQNYPNLELTLTDTEDQAMARRTFQPVEYLAKSDIASIKHGMPPASEVSIKLYLDTQTIKATGYRLFVYYP